MRSKTLEDLNSRIFETAKIVTKDVRIGYDCLICDYAFVASRKLLMEDGSQIGIGAILGGGGDIYLGKRSVVGNGAILLPATYTKEGRFMCESVSDGEREVIRGSITLGEGAYIGCGAVVCVSRKCPDIEVGDYSIVGALTYLDESLPPRTVIYPKKEYVTKKRTVDFG